MDAETIYEVLKKLIGNIEPVADSNIDEKNLENINKFIFIFKEMHSMIDDIAYKHSNSPYSSAKKIGLIAKKQLDSMNIQS